MKPAANNGEDWVDITFEPRKQRALRGPDSLDFKVQSGRVETRGSNYVSITGV